MKLSEKLLTIRNVIDEAKLLADDLARDIKEHEGGKDFKEVTNSSVEKPEVDFMEELIKSLSKRFPDIKVVRGGTIEDYLKTGTGIEKTEVTFDKLTPTQEFVLDQPVIVWDGEDGPRVVRHWAGKCQCPGCLDHPEQATNLVWVNGCTSHTAPTPEAKEAWEYTASLEGNESLLN